MSIKKEVLEYLKENKKYFYEKYGIKSIKLFGSVARGEDNKNSDIDLLVEFDYTKPMNFDRFFGIIEEMESKFKRKVDLAENLKKIAFKKAKKDFVSV